MRITDIREATASISSEIRNAYVDFSQMTVSVVAVESDVLRRSRPVTGYGFCSNGRYAQGGILRERLIPRLRAADPVEFLNSRVATVTGPERRVLWTWPCGIWWPS